MASAGVGSPQQPSPRRNIIGERLPGIAGGTATGMFAPLLAIGAVAACADGGGDCGDVICWSDTGGGSSSASDCHYKPTTHAAFWGSLVGSTTYGTVLADAAYKAAGHVLKSSIAFPALKGWGIGGAAGSAGAVGVVALGEATHHAYQSHKAHGERQRTQNDIELGLREPKNQTAYPTAPERAHFRGVVA